MFAFDLLGVNFPDGMRRGGELAIRDSGRIRVDMAQAKRLEQLWQFHTDFLRAPPEPLRQDHPRQMSTRRPQPARRRFALHATPPLLHFCSLAPADLSRHRVGPAPCHDGFVDSGERAGLFFNSPLPVVGLTCSTRAIARTPLPLRGIATLCCFTVGRPPG